MDGAIQTKPNHKDASVHLESMQRKRTAKMKVHLSLNCFIFVNGGPPSQLLSLTGKGYAIILNPLALLFLI